MVSGVVMHCICVSVCGWSCWGPGGMVAMINDKLQAQPLLKKNRKWGKQSGGPSCDSVGSCQVRNVVMELKSLRMW